MESRQTNHGCTRWATWNVAVALLLASAAGLPTAQAGDAFPRNQIVFPFAPAAMADGPGALRFNPAALGIDPNFALTYYHTYSDSSWSGNDALYATLRGVGFAAEWYGEDGSAPGRSYTIGFGTPGQQALSLGSSYQWRSSDDPVQNKSHFWSHGILWRARANLSLAVVADNYNRMRTPTGRSDAEFVYSAAMRFFDDRLTVGGDWYQRTSQSLGDGAWRLATVFTPTDGVTIYSDLDEDHNFFVGARVNLANFFTGSHAAWNRDHEYLGGVAYAGVNTTRQRPLFSVRREVVHLNLTGEVPDRPAPRRLFGTRPLSTLEWLELFEKARLDPEVRAVVLRIDDPQLGWARREEMRRAILRLRGAGKYVLAYSDGQISNGEYYLATAADRIVVPPVSSVDLVGLKAEIVFATRLLGKLGITADLERIGEYKSAADLVTRTEMSPLHRRATDSLLDDLDAFWIAGMAAGRGVDTTRVRAWINHGPFVSEDAQTAGLVDTVAFASQLDSLVRAAVGSIRGRVSQGQFASRQYEQRRWLVPRVTVVCASGAIQEGRDDSSPLFGEVMGAQSIAAAIRQARNDRRTRAIVLRINSGGGSMFGSDEIWREVTQTVGHKPLIVSFGDIAASGGYYIACAADSIFALPNTITGSIGVISGKLETSELYDKVGLDREVLTRGKYADLYGASHRFTDDERAVIREDVARAYDRFVSLVAGGRGLPHDSVDAIGQGRVWSGTAARQLGLVDGFVDLHETINVAARMGRISPGAPFEVNVLPESRWQILDWGSPEDVASASLARLARAVFSGMPLASRLVSGDDGPEYGLPYVITVK